MQFYARLSIVPFTFIHLGIIMWYFLYWDFFPKYSLRRLLPWLFLVISFVAIPLLQVAIYSKMVSVKAIDDPFVVLIIIGESVLSLGLIFYLLRRRS
jgi:hypothetical protein